MMPGRILTVSAHADDTALCAGGVLSLFSDAASFDLTFSQHRGVEVNYFSSIKQEHEEAMAILNVKDYFLSDLEACNGDFFQDAAFIRNKLEDTRDSFKPDLVLTHPFFDTNQDHKVIHEEVVRVFKSFCTLLTYDFPSNALNPHGPMAYFDLLNVNVTNKMRAIGSYRSQIREGSHSYMGWEGIKGLASMRGMQVNADYAEAFYVERVIV